MDFAPSNYGIPGFPRALIDPIVNKLTWHNEDWDPALRFWTFGWDPLLTEWLKDQDPSLAAITAAREFAKEHPKGLYNEAVLEAKKWLIGADHLKWKNNLAAIRAEIDELFDLMEDDRDRYLAEIEVQADGLPAYMIAFLGIDSERRPWTIELIRCGLAIGNVVYMNYKELFRRVRPSTIAPGLVPPFGPPRHPSFPSGHAFLGHFIALLLLEIPEVAKAFGEKNDPANDAERGKPPSPDDLLTDARVFNGPLMWLAERLGKNRERAGLHYPSDSLASRRLAGVMWAMLTNRQTANQNLAMGPVVAVADAITLPTLNLVLSRAKAEWVRP
jgi:hypothetical protein